GGAGRGPPVGRPPGAHGGAGRDRGARRAPVGGLRARLDPAVPAGPRRGRGRPAIRPRLGVAPAVPPGLPVQGERRGPARAASRRRPVAGAPPARLGVPRVLLPPPVAPP